MSTWREPSPVCWLLKTETFVMQIKGPDLKNFEVGNRVLLATKNLHIKQNKLSKKLLPRYIGPFKILKKVGTQAYELELPPTMKMYDVFHVSLLKTYHA